MVFSSALFLTMFFPLVLEFYFLAQERLRNYVLLMASLLFYARGEPKAVFVMISLIAVSCVAALAIEKYPRLQSADVYVNGKLRCGLLNG